MKTLVTLAASVAASLLTLVAHAAGDCSALKKLEAGGVAGSVDAPPVYYVTGSSAIKPVLAALAPVIFADPVHPATLVYVSQGSCAGVDAIIGTRPFLPTTANGASYWDPNSVQTATSSRTSKEETCTVPASTSADLGASDVFAETCPGLAPQGLPPGFADFQGPIQSMTFAVNKGSKEQVISAEAAYVTMGLGTLAPWVDNDFIFRRDDKSGTQLMIATAIGVDASRWIGKNAGGSTQVFTSLANLTSQVDRDKGIGILAADYSARTELKQLAYQHYGQRCGYRPDVQPLDKKNVRDGRYAIWGPVHLFTATAPGSTVAQNERVRDLISYLLGTQAPPLGLNLIRTEVDLHVVPPCAMKVQRKSEMGPMTPFTPSRACGCAFDREAVGTTSCTPCTTNQQCGPNQSCNFNFCEAQ